MIIQATPYGTTKEEPFAFTYSGDFTDERVDGIGDVTLNTSGQLVTSGKTVRVSVYILAGGGGGVTGTYGSTIFYALGGSGGYQIIEVELVPGTYEIVIGSGGNAASGAWANEQIASNGGDTSAFGVTCTGGKGGYTWKDSGSRAGAGGTPNGAAGTAASMGNLATATINGGSPNGGGLKGITPQPGGNGLVRITFS